MGLIIVILTVTVFVVSASTTHVLLRIRAGRLLLDYPNERSLHDGPIPLGGGLSIALGIVVGGIGLAMMVSAPDYLVWLMAGAMAIIVVSFIDDLSHVHPGIRIFVHLLVAVLLVFAGIKIDSLDLPGVHWVFPEPLSTVVTLLFVGWLINLYNFMDGMDGLAPGMAVIGFGTYAILGIVAGDPLFAGFSLTVCAASSGFLLFNFPPARIFMGDVGSSLLGFLAAGLSLWASVQAIFPIWLGILVFSPFIVDATFTLGYRLWRRERVWEAHKTHCYQRLVELGWGHRKTVLWEYVLMVLCSASAVIAMYLQPSFQWWLLLIWAVAYVILFGLVHRLDSRRGGNERIEAL